METALASSFDLGPALDSLMKAGPVACALLIFIGFLIKQLNKKDAQLLAKDALIAQKDARNDTLQAATFTIAEKQAELGGLVKDRLRRIEYALKLRSNLLPEGLEHRDDGGSL